MHHPGVYAAKYKNGRKYYRSSVTYRNRHISLGSYASSALAGKAYLEASELLHTPMTGISDYSTSDTLPFEKWVTLCNFRDNDIYIANPVYIRPKFFYYYLTPDIFFTFDQDDLFYYSAHKIMKRGGHYFVADYGMQISINSRYGIPAYAVAGRDYIFRNGNTFDMRSVNINIVNPYRGVSRVSISNGILYESKIHINGYCRIGLYSTAAEAAVAYNKAADIITASGILHHYAQNYIESLSPSEYADVYSAVNISPNLSRVCRRIISQKNRSC